MSSFAPTEQRMNIRLRTRSNPRFQPYAEKLAGLEPACLLGCLLFFCGAACAGVAPDELGRSAGPDQLGGGAGQGEMGRGAGQDELDRGVRARVAGNINESIALLQLAVQKVHDPASRARALTQLGVTLTQGGRLAEADEALQSAYKLTPEGSDYSIALALGNVAIREHDGDRAVRYYDEVISSSGGGALAEDARVTAELNLAALRPADERLSVLEKLLPRVEVIKGTANRARAFFAFGQLASEALAALYLPVGPLTAGAAPAQPAAPAGQRPKGYDRLLELAFLGFDNAARLAGEAGDGLLGVDAADALAQLYESQGRLDEAYEINRQGLEAAASLTLGQSEFALVRLEWRAGRVQHARGEDSLAVASYLRAARRLESIRQDLPIEDARGKSTFQTLQRPLFVGLADLMLKDLDALPADRRQVRLASTVGVIELTRQAELQDYLGDRCSVDSVSQATGDSLAKGVAIVYPVVLKDRLEIIVRANGALLHHTSQVTAAALQDEIQNFRSALLDASSNDYLGPSRNLYGWLLEPFEHQLAGAGIRQLIIVPDGYLRLIPFGAMHDGKQFMAERFSISTVTGLTKTEAGAPRWSKPMSLLAGLSTPGPVVERLMAMGFTGGAQFTASATSRGLPDRPDRSAQDASPAARTVSLRGELALPGVKAEIQGLAPLERSRSLLDGEFTVDRFTREVQSGNYRVVHVASHGFFGASADQSFLLAYDNIIKIGDLQRLIAVEGQSPGIDLLTLSACDTATGDERAPLGFAGAAIKARARSVVGTLWAVSDRATQQFMQDFYADLAHHGKAEALTQAQRSLLRSGQFSHPYFWAPFVLTGDWN
jgi:CHAT domain-containing protein